MALIQAMRNKGTVLKAVRLFRLACSGRIEQHDTTRGKNVGTSVSKKASRMLVLACLLACILFALCGCVISDTITERIIDNDPSSQIDYDLDPILINTPTATETTEKLPKIDEAESNQEQDQEESLPELTDDESKATTSESAPKPEYNANVQSNGVVTNTPTTATPNSGQTAPASTTPEPPPPNDGNWSDVNDNNKDQGDNTPDNPTKTDEPTEEPDPNKDGPQEGDDNNGRKPGGTGDYYSDVPNMDDPEIPENVDEVVAFGNNAVIVSIISGNESSSALLGCDAKTWSQTSSVLAARGMASVKTIDYIEGQGMSAEAFNQLIDIKPDQVYVTEGENPFSQDQVTELQNSKINVYTLPALTSDSRIRFTFQVIGRTLENGGVAGAMQRCDDYLNLCSSIVDTCSNNNGGLTGGYDFDEGREVDTGASPVVTLFVDGWDDGARYMNSQAGPLDSSSGAATATIGYTLSPVCYYLSAGGVLNNAASFKIRKHIERGSGRALLWQFQKVELSGALENWSGLSAQYYDMTQVVGGLFADSLLCYTDDLYGLGTETFPALVARDQRIAGLLQMSASNPNGLYHAYGNITSIDLDTTVGYIPNEGSTYYVHSCIGRDENGTTAIPEGSSYDVYVNPKGLCQSASDDTLCSWTAGSPESVLEASWAYWKFRSNDQSAFEQDVANFYQQCYGYSVSPADLQAIEAGTAS